jgi:hypothetical protein
MPISTLNQSPGVLLEEVPADAVAPVLVSTGVGAMLCVTEKGPIEARQVTSFGEWKRLYGRQLQDLDSNANLKYSANQQAKNFFRNGGRVLWTKRVVHYTDITDAATITAKKSAVILRDGDVAVPATIGASVQSVGTGTAHVSSGTYTGLFDATYVITCLTGGLLNGSAATFQVSAIGGDEHGIISSTVTPTTGVAFAVGTKGVMLTLTNAGSVSVGDTFKISVTAKGNPVLKVEARWHGAYANTDFVNNKGLAVSVSAGAISGTYKITEWVDGVVGRTFDNLQNQRTDTLGNLRADFAELEINSPSGSEEIRVSVLGPTNPVTGFATPIPLVSGDDGLVGLSNSDYTGDSDAETGIHGYNTVKEILVLGCPDKENDITVVNELIAWVERYHPRSHLVHSLPYDIGFDGAKVYMPITLAKDSSRYSAYYPWIKTDGNWVSPTMAIAGLYMVNDALPQRGVWSSPAGTDLSFTGVEDIEVRIGDTKGGVLNENRVNVLRIMPNAGLVIWGSRTGTVSQQKYFRFIGSRRNTNYVAMSLEKSSAFAAHHDTGPDLWRKLTNTFESFLFRHWRAGGFRGQSKSEAYFVKVDGEINPPSNEEQGITRSQVGIWNKKTNEFLIIELSQLGGETSVSEGV